MDLNNLKTDVLRNIDKSTFELEYGKSNRPLFDFRLESWTNLSIDNK